VAIALVQSASQAFAFANTARSKAFASNVNGGNLLVATIATFGTSITVTLTDSAGRTWVQAGSTVTNGSTRIRIYYVANCAAGACTLTVTPSGNANVSIGLHEYSGVTPVNPLTAVSTGTGTGTAVTTGVVGIDSSGDLIVGASSAGSFVTSITAGGGYTLRANLTGSGDSVALGSEDNVSVSVGGVADFTFGGSVGWVAIGASFASTTADRHQADFADALTWTDAFDTPPGTNDVLTWSGAFSVFGLSSVVSDSLTDTLTWTTAMQEDQLIFHTLSWSGSATFLVNDSFDRDSDTLLWSGVFEADAGSLSSGRYRR
jgi:hypothetical protein